MVIFSRPKIMYNVCVIHFSGIFIYSPFSLFNDGGFAPLTVANHIQHLQLAKHMLLTATVWFRGLN